MNYIERRANLWYATLTIPSKIRPTLGKSKFIQSLGTPDRKEALTLAAPLIAHWKSIIREASGEEGAVITEARRWKELFSKASTRVERDVLEDMIRDKAERFVTSHSESLAQDFYQVAYAGKTESNALFEKWKAELKVVPKAKEQYTKDVSLFLSRFSLIEQVTKASVRLWIESLLSNGTSPNSATRILGSCRSYWKYLVRHELASADINPFIGHLETTSKRSKGKKGWVPFTPEEIVALHSAAVAKRDTALADLIYLAAYSGARIEELCSLKLTSVRHDRMSIEDAKTEAGVRQVPIHSQLQPLIERLKSASLDGYLLHGLTFNKYSDRSNAIGKRFGRLKKALGHSDLKVFHSIRKTFVTQLENAGIPEGVAADIIGHEKPTITFGLYSGGNRLDVMKAAVEKVTYPFD